MTRPVTIPKPAAAVAVCLLLASVGCGQRTDVQWTSSEQVQKLDPKLQSAVRTQLHKYCGTPSRPLLLGEPVQKINTHLALGAATYQARCAGCHGASGDGAGPAAAYMYPRPRDYRRGIFKFTSTPYGAKPLRDDLVRTVRRGALGTSMPSFKFLDEESIQAVVDYVLVLTHRGELEQRLAFQAENDDEVDAEAVPEQVETILEQWHKAPEQVVYPLTRETPYTTASIDRGKQAFLSEIAGCYKCHGKDGRGQPASNPDAFTDSWGHPTKAADLSAGMFHGGREPEDIYRRMYSGINGTPMPSFAAKLSDQPDTFWDLVHYVQYISSARRREVMAEEAAYQQRIAEASARSKGP